MKTYLIVLHSMSGSHKEKKNFLSIKEAKEYAEKERIANGCHSVYVCYYGKARKTKDEYQLHINYGQGWEHELSEDTRQEARQRLKEYRENCPQYPTKIVVKRVKIES